MSLSNPIHFFFFLIIYINFVIWEINRHIFHICNMSVKAMDDTRMRTDPHAVLRWTWQVKITGKQTHRYLYLSWPSRTKGVGTVCCDSQIGVIYPYPPPNQWRAQVIQHCNVFLSYRLHHQMDFFNFFYKITM